MLVSKHCVDLDTSDTQQKPAPAPGATHQGPVRADGGSDDRREAACTAAAGQQWERPQSNDHR